MAGNAKLRGTREQRIEQSIARKKRERELLEFYRNEECRYRQWFRSRLNAQQRFEESCRLYKARQAAILTSIYGGIGSIGR